MALTFTIGNFSSETNSGVSLVDFLGRVVWTLSYDGSYC